MFATDKRRSGFTIVELLIVIIVIAILAAVVVVAYQGIQAKAQRASLQSDVREGVAQLANLKDANGYPATADAVKHSSGSVLSYTTMGSGFCLSAGTPTQSVGAFYSYNYGSVQAGSCPIGEWDFDGNAGDASPGMNDGVASGVSAAADKAGNANGAYSFDGSSSYVSLPASLALPQAEGSIAAWVKLQDYGQPQNIVFYGSSGEDGCTGLPAISLASCGFVVQGSNGVVSAPVPSFLDGQWHQLIGTWSASAGKVIVYMDGTQRSSVALTFTPTFSQQVSYIGRPGSASRYAKGTIDDVKIYDHALSAAEAAQLYQATQ